MQQTILIIDSDPATHQHFIDALRGENLRVHAANDTMTGLAMAADLRPDVVMAGLDTAVDGWEVCRQLKSEAAMPEMPIVLLMNDPTAQQQTQALHAGAEGWLTRPLNPLSTLAMVRTCLRNKRLTDLLSQKAMLDGLTGLWNRTYFQQRLQAEIAHATRTERLLACIILDIDRLADINRLFGRPAGDQIVRRMGQVLVAQARIEDVVCRFGGDEFAILTPGVGTVGAESLAERLCLSLSNENFMAEGQRVQVTCSLGLAGTGTTSVEHLVSAAARAACRARLLGGGCVVRAESLDEAPSLP